MNCDFQYGILFQSKSERVAAYSTPPVRPVHDRLGVRHPNKTLNKTVMEASAEDKNEKVTVAVVIIPALTAAFYLWVIDYRVNM